MIISRRGNFFKEKRIDMKTVKALVTLALSATLLTGCAAVNKDAIITVNDKSITKSEFQKAFDSVANNSMLAQMGIDLKNDTNSHLHLLIKDRVVNELIVKNLLEQDIEKRKIKVTSEEIDKELRKIIDQIGSKEKFNEILQQNGISSSQFKKDMESEVKMQKLVDNLKPVEISDKEAEKFYKANIDRFKYPQMVKASHILVAADKDEIRALIMADTANKNLTPAEIDAKVKAELGKKYDKAKKLLTEVKKDPTSFAKIAKENSDDFGSAQQGGDLGYFPKEQMVAEFSKAAFSLKPSTVSDIVVTQYGYHIIMVTDRKEAGQESFDKVKADIKAVLAQQEKINVLQQHVDKLKKEAKIVFVDESYNPDNIQKQIKEKGTKAQPFSPVQPQVNKETKK